MALQLSFLTEDHIQIIINDAYRLLESIGIKIESNESLKLLSNHGIRINKETLRAYFLKKDIEKALKTAPHSFLLYSREGDEPLQIGATDGSGETYFIPGSAALNILDSDTKKERPAVRADLEILGKITENLSAYKIQSTAIVPSDVLQNTADYTRLYHALLSCSKPMITGTFIEESLDIMIKMLEIVRGGEDALKDRPLAIFDACPTAPLTWPHLTLHTLIRCAKAGIPTTIIPVPLLGATGPVTLQGSLTQIVAENLSGIVIHQLAKPGSPVVWGGCPMAFDMRYGTTSTGAPETMLLNAASAQIAKTFHLPTHGYLALSDAKNLDMQAGFETSMGALTAALSNLNLVSGAGMLNFIGCQSFEKLAFDASIIESAMHIKRGITRQSSEDLISLFDEALQKGSFLKLKHTRDLFRTELYPGSTVLDRSPVSDNKQPACFERCHMMVKKLSALPIGKRLDPTIKVDLEGFMSHLSSCLF